MGAELLATLLTFLVVNPYRTRKHQDEAGHNNPESLRTAERICWLNENELQENVRPQKEKEEAPEKQQSRQNISNIYIYGPLNVKKIKLFLKLINF